jgi:hypothetical protein
MYEVLSTPHFLQDLLGTGSAKSDTHHKSVTKDDRIHFRGEPHRDGYAGLVVNQTNSALGRFVRIPTPNGTKVTSTL